MSAVAEARTPVAGLADRAVGAVRAHPYLTSVLALGLLLRLVLVPLTFGGDFGMWSLTAAAALHGQDTYANTPLPISKAGPYAYFPLYLYILLPLKWLALHTGLPYVVLGKLPVVAGDLGVTLALAGVLRRGGSSEAAGALGAALFFLNPMVLYNGPFYGRFDSLCLASLLLAWRYLERPAGSGWRMALWYALGVTLKTFPIVLLPYLLRRAGWRRGIGAALAALALPVIVSLPYLLHNAGRFLYIVFVYDSIKGPRQFSWQLALLNLGHGEEPARLISYGLLALFALSLLLFIPAATPAPAHGVASLRVWVVENALRGKTLDPYIYGAVAFTLFLLLSKVVYEQYFLWPLPFLIVVALRDRALTAWLLILTLSTTGLLANTWIHPFGYRPVSPLWLNAAIAAVALSFVASRWRARARRDHSHAVVSTTV